MYDQVLGFSEYIEEVYAAYEQHRLETMVMLHYRNFPRGLDNQYLFLFVFLKENSFP